MRALTLWRPWPWAIFRAPLHSAKRIENRPWKPWPSIIGKRIVLHAGKAFQKDAVDDILDNVLLDGEPRVLPASATDEGLLGVVTIAGCVETAEGIDDLCTACGNSHEPANRRRLIRPMLDETAADIAAEWSCFYPPTSAGERRLYRDIRAIRDEARQAA